MNIAKVIIGGLLAGLVINVIDYIVNVPWLGEQWAVATKALNVTASEGGSAAGWVITDFLSGIVLVWLYASIRPRYGAGPKTAVIAGFSVWFIKCLVFASYVFMSIYPLSLMGASAVGGYVAVIAGALAGCGIYKEG
jgi:hypothetical protein